MFQSKQHISPHKIKSKCSFAKDTWRIRLLGLIFILSFSPALALSEVLVFIHGYQSNALTWHKHHIIASLTQQGWQDSGVLAPHPQLGIAHYGPKDLKPYRLVSVELPSEAPLEIQAQLLNNYLDFILKQQGEQNISLIAHSAGGLVARLMLITQPNPQVKRLISIASPHLGTGMAEVGSILAQSPVSWFSPAIGLDNLDRSEHLFEQMEREQPGSILFWLNRQQHPEIDYISIVRSSGSFLNQDFFVPPYSQDMRNIPGIKSAIFIPSRGDHELQYRDGVIISQIVNQSAK